MGYENGSVVITGGSKGIGLSIAKIFAQKSRRPIVLLARNSEDLQQAKQACLDEGATYVHTEVADITKQEITKIDFEKYQPAILINNAGSFLYKELEQTSPEEFESQFRINALGAFNVTKQLLPGFRKQERALIVNICSQASLKGLGDSGAYSASKHATLGYTRSLRKELMQTGIAVTAINLGQTYSTSWDGVDIDPEKLIDPEDIGRMILCLSELSPRSVAEEIILMPQGGDVAPM